MAFDLSLEFILSGKPKRVMQLLTDAELIRKWSGSDGVVEKKVGGRFEMFDGWVTGEVLKISDHELVHTWRITEWPEEMEATKVHYLLKAKEGGTKVILHHTGFATEDEMKSNKSGWADFVFDPMEDFMLIIDKS